MHNPIIEHLSVNSQFRYLWLKYIKDYDLGNHCAKSLVGSYTKADLKKVESLNLNEYDSKTYYMCGVAFPFVWSNNFHLAFKYSKGSDFVYESNGITIKVRDAVRIPIEQSESYDLHPKGKLKTFNTCRNWIFAYNQVNNIQ
jgi:hypothetical protein